MTYAPARCIAPPCPGYGTRLLAAARAALRTLRRHHARAAAADAAARRETVIAQDLAHLDRRLLRDIGLGE